MVDNFLFPLYVTLLNGCAGSFCSYGNCPSIPTCCDK